jgi:hypothetical protein
MIISDLVFEIMVVLSGTGLLIICYFPYYLWKDNFRYGSKKRRLEEEIKELKGDLAKAELELGLC